MSSRPFFFRKEEKRYLGIEEMIIMYIDDDFDCVGWPVAKCDRTGKLI